MRTDPILDKLLKKRREAVKGAPTAPLQMAEDIVANEALITPEAREQLEKRPALQPEFVEAQAAAAGVPVERAQAIAAEIQRQAGPALVIESYRAENELKDVFRQLYEAEVLRLQHCPARVKGVTGWQQCGVPLDNIQQALVHHSMHLLWESNDDKVKRAVANDISEKLFPTDIKGVRAALTADERRAALSDPRIRDRLLRRHLATEGTEV